MCQPSSPLCDLRRPADPEVHQAVVNATRTPSARDLGFSCLSGLLLIVIFPSFDFSIVAWVALVPLLLALEQKSLKQAFLYSHVTGALFFSGFFSWIWAVEEFTFLDSLCLQILYFPLSISLWGLGLTWIRNRTGLPIALVAPPLWVTIEYLRHHLSWLSLPFMPLGYSQYLHPSLTQVVSWTGVFGLSFVIVLVNVAIMEVLLYVRHRATGSIVPRFPTISVMTSALLLTLIPLYGVSVLDHGHGARQGLQIATVQGNIPVNHKWDGQTKQMILDKYANLTREAARSGASLIIWPESAVPGDVIHNNFMKRTVGGLAREISTYLLVGNSENAKFENRRIPGKFYNSLVLFSPAGEIEAEYRKIKLMPFGEYPPLKEWITWPKAIASSIGNVLPGSEYTIFTVGEARLGAVICWEVFFPEHFREFVRRGARVMVVASNEAWYGETAAPSQFQAMTTFRAVENRVAVVRSTNSGLSGFIDPFGRITDLLGGQDQKTLFVAGVLASQVPLTDTQTFYTQYGDLFAFVQISLCGLIFLYACLTAWFPALACYRRGRRVLPAVDRPGQASPSFD